MINNKLFSSKKLILAVLLVSTVMFNHLYAQTESYMQTLTGIIKPKAACRVVDEKFADQKIWATIESNSKVQNLLTFELRYDSAVNFYNKPFACELIVDVDYKDGNNTEKKLSGIKLTLQYDSVKAKSYKGIAYYKFDGGHDVTVTVKSIFSKELDMTKTDFLRIKNQILIDRTYKKREGNKEAPLLLTRGSKKDITGPETAGRRAGNQRLINNDRQMQFDWLPADFEYDKYDLEYTFYDYNSLLSTQYFSQSNIPNINLLEDAFRNNATRVSIDQPTYTINNVYPHGYVLVRVRSYKYVLVDGEMDREEGVWHYTGDNTGVAGWAVYEAKEHGEQEGIFLNWQYSAAFAEDGKRKEVVSYFDGGNKSRQSVTISNNNDESNTIVAESVLDKQNRPAVSILPVPVKDNTLHFFPSFNRNPDEKLYTYDDFNPDNYCTSVARPMHPGYGSSQYYSSNNPWVDQPITKDVPDAKGFPFAVTEFTNDQTGRIRRQGGVGETFQIGSDHETSYYYGKPSQVELDRLFGSEAGAAAHYAKNMVVDANGQVSVSYVDVAGKTVATSLAGKSPATLQPLKSMDGAITTIKDELIRPQSIVRDAANLKISFNTTVLVPAAADYNFAYEFSGRSLELIFGWNPETHLCADCYYDVKFSVSDECGEPVSLTYNGQQYFDLLVPATFNYGSNQPENPNTTCGVVIPSQAGTIVASFPKTGEYKVSYELVMSRKALDFYMDYIKQAKVTKTIEDVKKEYLKKIDLTGCFSDCRDCIQKLGTQGDFVIRIKKILLEVDNIVVTTDDMEWIVKLYNETLRKCSESVAKNCTITDGCSDYRKMMLKDVTPGGQYMLYDEKTLLFKERDVLNVFLNVAKGDFTPTAPEVIINGQRKFIRDLQESELISNWQPEWAYLMLQYHPEICLLRECEHQSASKNRDKQMMQTDDDIEAGTKYSWNAGNYSAFIAAETAALTASQAPQPYGVSCIMTDIQNRMNKFLPGVPVRLPIPGITYNPAVASTYIAMPSRDVSLMELIKYTIYCPDNLKAQEDPVTHQMPFVNLAGIPQTITCPQTLAEWRLFRNLYVAVKQAAFRNPACKNDPSCKNCFIGVNAYSTLYNPKADPLYYPQPKDFVIEANGSGGLQLRYNNAGDINNRCDVYVYKATLAGGTVTTSQVLKAEYQENGNKIFQIAGANADDIDLYFVEHLINNYNHNIDGTVPASNCPNRSDFTFWRNDNGHTHYLNYIGKYPLLNKVHFYLVYHQSADIGNCGDMTWEGGYDPLESGQLQTINGGCKRYGPDFSIENYCEQTVASCISDSRWPFYFQKTRRFYESNAADDITPVLQGANGGQPLGNDPGNGTNYTQNAEEMSAGWMQKLQGCANPLDPNDAARREQLRLRLIAVCVAGSDLMHPYGASTTKNNVPTVPYGDRSFKDAIVWYLGGPETPTCNAFAIDFPVPYGGGANLNDDVVNKLSECGYRLLTRFKAEWLAAGGASNAEYPTLATYIKKNYDPNFYLTDVQIADLITSYVSGCPLKRPIRIPGFLTRCDDPKTPTCLKCTQLYNVEAQFNAAYPQFTVSLPNYYELLAGYINDVYKMNVAPTDVYAAIEKCKKGGNYHDACSSNNCAAVYKQIMIFTGVMPPEEFFKMIICGGKSCEEVTMLFHNYITTWLNLTLGWNFDYNYYATHYFGNSSCGKSTIDSYMCTNLPANYTVNCSCTPYAIRCCDNYAPFTFFRSEFPNPIDPKIMAFFFEMRRSTVCAPTNLPNIAYTQPYNVLVNYFNNLIPTVIPNCIVETRPVNANSSAVAPVVASTETIIKNAQAKINNSLSVESGINAPTACYITISGNVWNDVNGMNDNLVNNSAANVTPVVPIPAGIYAYLTYVPYGGDPNADIVKAVVAVNPSSGTYAFTSVPANTNYKVYISSAVVAVGTAISGSVLPTPWNHTGQNIGTGPGSDGLDDGIVVINIVCSDFTNVNFGIHDNGGIVVVYECPLWQFTYKTTPVIKCNDIYDSTFGPKDLVLCTQPLTPHYQSDEDACIKSTVNAALGNAEYAYAEYIKDFMRDYREAYFAKCLSITPSLVMSGEQQEYHYTLYYYDQAGNLVKTIPPAGVKYLDQTQIQKTGRLRDEDNGECYQNATAPKFENTASHKVTVPAGFYPLHTGGPLTVESWIKPDNANTDQFIVNQFDDAGSLGKAGYYAYLKNGKLYFSIFGRSKETWVEKKMQWLYPLMVPNVKAHYYIASPANPNPFVRIRQFRAECHTENDITTIGGTNNGFYHIVFQYSGDPTDLYPVKIYVNGVLQTINWPVNTVTGVPVNTENGFIDGLHNIPNTQVASIDDIKYEQVSVETPFSTASLNELVVGSASRTVNALAKQGMLGSMKHLRIYNAAPDAADLRRNSFDGCFMPAVKEGLVLWLPLNKETGGYTEDLQSGQHVPIVANWANPALPQYPEHNLPTYYAYNSLNQVLRQETPDAGKTNFWYDRLGRLVISQNAEQVTPIADDVSKRYSYTNYDVQGRIDEVGEKLEAADPFSIDTRNPADLSQWMASGTDRQITNSIYDVPNPQITTDPQIYLDQTHHFNSRKRIVTSIYREKKSPSEAKYNFATHYVYDISGNVKRLYQENKRLSNGIDVLTTKKLDYNFDLISGKVNEVYYQKDQQDQYLYRYTYDADNKLIKTVSGRDELTLRTDASYQYYKHGPLGRTELGHDDSKLQGIDYAYTLQGWLKGINGLRLNKNGSNREENYDLGDDGITDNDHADFPADIYAYSLGYYGDKDGHRDYKPINERSGRHPIAITEFGFNPGSNETGQQLFNGNIAYTSYANRMFSQDELLPASYSYHYDQLNRLVDMRSHKLFNPYPGSQEWSSQTTIKDYAESISYDANGNIQSYHRNGTDQPGFGGLDMDQLNYYYADPANNNKLEFVKDGVDAAAYAEDIDAQTGQNYNYDNTGNLLSDHAEKIKEIRWTVYGKIKSILKDDGTEIQYSYDAAGNRISKTVKKDGRSNTTYYYRDASGNVMAVYEQKDINTDWVWKEQHLYGSSRLGMWSPDMTMVRPGQGEGEVYSYDETQVGSRSYELTNHLGNVMSVITDKKWYTGSYWEVAVLNANDYYPFGMQMPGRKYDGGNGYRYGFTGHEKLDEIQGENNFYDMGARLYNPRIGRTPSIDSKSRFYPSVSPYTYSLNTPIQAKDPDGNVVIFINGQHSGEGGTAKYWAGYDQKVMDAIGDHSARYVDGALGGFENTLGAFSRGRAATEWWEYIGAKKYVGAEAVRVRNGVKMMLKESNVNRIVREQAGFAQGGIDVKGIFANLTEGESIKIVTHSMGAAYSRGYIKALQDYMITNKITNHKIELVVDVNAFQGAELSAVSGTTTLNKTGGNDGKSIFGALLYAVTGQGISVPTVDKVKGSTDITSPDEKNNSHEVNKMTTDGIPKIGNAGITSHKPIEEGNNNGQPIKRN